MTASTGTLTKQEITEIAQKDDLHIAPFREDGVTYGTPTWIWNVAIDDQLYVRAYNGTKSRWYQSAIKQKAGKIEAAGMVKKIQFETVTDANLNEKIDDAYRRKYSDSPYLQSMISERAKAATVRVF